MCVVVSRFNYINYKLLIFDKTKSFNLKREDKMNTQNNVYQSMLQNLSLVPIEYLRQVDEYLQAIIKRNIEIEANRKAILALAGSWNDRSEKEFEEFREDIKNNTKHFSRIEEL